MNGATNGRRSGLRANQRVRLSELIPQTWPEARSDPKINSPVTPLHEAVDNLVHNVRLSEDIPEYGPQSLALYRGLRDLLVKTKKQPEATSNGHTNGSTNGTGPSILAAKQLTDELWAKYLSSIGEGDEHDELVPPPASPFEFPDKTTNHRPAIPGDQHDEATTELANGYDTCLLRAQEQWTASDKDENMDMMAVFGAAISEWCANYTKWHPGQARRWSLYSAMADKELVSRIAQLVPRRDCHMKDALLQGMTGREVVDTVILPCTGMFSDSPFGAGYSGNKVWEASLLVTIVVWADYAGAEDAKSSAGARAWDLIAPWVSALGCATGVAADEIKATTMTLYGAKLGTFQLPPIFDCTHIWRSRGYDGGVHTSGAAIAMTRGIPYPEDERTLDLAGTVMAIHDAIDCEADVINRTECNLVLITLRHGVSVECFVDTVYATLVVNWTAKDIYGQFPIGALQEQTSGSRWGGPAYSSEARAETNGRNFWTDKLTSERIASVIKDNVQPTTTKELIKMWHGPSWHEIALYLSAQEILASPFGQDNGEPPAVEDILTLSKGTFVLLCCTCCSACGNNPTLKLDDWGAAGPNGYSDEEYSVRVMAAVDRARSIVREPLDKIRNWLHSDPRPDAVYRITAEAFMAVSSMSRVVVMLLEGLIIEDALYHGADTLSYCVRWLPEGLVTVPN